MKKHSLHIRLLALMLVSVMFLCSCVELPLNDGLDGDPTDNTEKRETAELTESQIKATERETEATEKVTEKNYKDSESQDDSQDSNDDQDDNTDNDTDNNTDEKPDGTQNDGNDGSGEETEICDHSFGDWKTVKEPECLGVEGEQEATCTKCRATKHQTVLIEGHISIVDDPAVEATCKKEGLTAGKHCEACGTVLVRQTTVSLRSHTYDNDEDATCNVCGNERNVQCKHTSKTTLAAKAATCTESGLSAGEKCNKCGEVLVEQRVVNALGHSEQVIKGYAATETEWGLTDGVKCTVCYAVLVEQKTVFPTGYTNIDRYVDDYGYEALAQFTNGAAMQSLYKSIAESTSSFHTDSSLNAIKNGSFYIVDTFNYDDYGLTLDEATAVWAFFRHDHPLYYWYSGQFAYDSTNKKICVLTEEDYVKGLDRAEYNKTVFEAVKSYVARVQGETSPYRISLALHDAIIANIDYAYKTDGVTPEEALWAHNVLGVFEKNSGVCESYAKTFQLLLNYCEIENIYVTGRSQNQSHAWNMVKMDDGEWYWFDLTWDDKPDWMWGITYNYFCVNSTEDVSWIDGPWLASSSMSFAQTHVPFNPSTQGVNCQYELPDVSESTANLDVPMLRDTFDVNGLTYAIVGYNAVQLVGVTNASTLVIPESVTYEGAKYEVISIGAISDGLLQSDTIEVTGAAVKSVSIPETVIFIWDSALMLKKLESITVDADNPVYTSQNGVLFTKSLYTLVQYPLGSAITAYVIPDQTVELAHKSFGIASGGALKKLTFGRSLELVGTMNAGYGYRNSADATRLNLAQGDFFYISQFMSFEGEICLHEQNSGFIIEDGALYDKDKTVLHLIVDKTMTSFACAESIRAIDVGAFLYCSALKELTLFATLEDIHTYAFGFCNIRTIYFEGSEEEWNRITKHNDWKYNSNISSVEYAY